MFRQPPASSAAVRTAMSFRISRVSGRGVTWRSNITERRGGVELWSWRSGGSARAHSMSRSTNALDRVQPLHPRTALVRIGALAVSARDRGFTLLELLIVL